MGQKVHPIGFRLNVKKGWNSVWFADKNNFSQTNSFIYKNYHKRVKEK